MDAGKYVVTFALNDTLSAGACGPVMRRFRSANELLRYLGCDWPLAKRRQGEEVFVRQALFVSHREIRL